MVNFPNIGKQKEPPARNMTPEEYLRFCSFCVSNNPHITPDTCMDRKSGEENLRVPFRVR